MNISSPEIHVFKVNYCLLKQKNYFWGYLSFQWKLKNCPSSFRASMKVRLFIKYWIK